MASSVDPDRGLPGLELAHRAFAVLEPLAVRGHPRGPPHEQPGGVDLGLHVGELERDRLVLDDRPAELHCAPWRSRARTRRRRGRCRCACAPTIGRVASNVVIAACFSAALPRSRARASLASSFSLPPSRQLPGTRTSSSTTSAVWLARMPCLRNFWPLRQARGAGRDDEAGLPAALQLRVDRGHDDVHVGDAAVGDPRLRAVEHPLVGGLVVDRPRAQAGHVAAGVGLAHAERTELHLVGRADSTAAPTPPPARACRCDDAGDRRGSSPKIASRCRRRPSTSPR